MQDRLVKIDVADRIPRGQLQTDPLEWRFSAISTGFGPIFGKIGGLRGQSGPETDANGLSGPFSVWRRSKTQGFVDPVGLRQESGR